MSRIERVEVINFNRVGFRERKLLLPLPRKLLHMRHRIVRERAGVREMDKSLLTERAKSLRKNSTDAERLLWSKLRSRQLGWKFRRQMPIGLYIADFVCLEKSLIIEFDGGQHLENQHYDEQRTTWLIARGFNVLRFWNNEVLQQITSVLERINRQLSESD